MTDFQGHLQRGSTTASGKRVTELLQRVKDAGLRPQTDAELLPHLMELMRKVNPVHRWPSRLTKSERVEIARERDQARAAACPTTSISAPQVSSDCWSA